MTLKTGHRQDFELMLRLLDNEPLGSRELFHRFYYIRDDGIYVKSPIDTDDADESFTVQEIDALSWNPYRDLSKPALPFPFDAIDLAAFCLPGPGLDLLQVLPSSPLESQERDEQGGIDRDALAIALGANSRRAIRLLTDAARAIDLMRRSFTENGTRAYRKTLRSKSLGTIPNIQEEDEASCTGLIVSVMEGENLEDEKVSWLFSRGTTAMREASTVGPKGIPTAKMATFLERALTPHGSRRRSSEWKRRLSDPPNWMLAYRLTPGSPGNSATWDPVELLLAIAIREHPTVDLKKLTNAFSDPAASNSKEIWEERIIYGE